MSKVAGKIKVKAQHVKPDPKVKESEHVLTRAYIIGEVHTVAFKGPRYNVILKEFDAWKVEMEKIYPDQAISMIMQDNDFISARSRDEDS